jgi:hypothetical protein
MASVVLMPDVSAQQQTAPAPAAAVAPAPATPAEIKQELEKIKKSRTLGIIPSVGTDDSGGTTVLRVDNTSAFTLVVLIVGPTTLRLELGPEGTQTLAVDPGDYEIAVTVVGRNLPPFYGKQTIVANMRFRHQFVIPAV